LGGLRERIRLVDEAHERYLSAPQLKPD
jgi:hypothetical protein